MEELEVGDLDTAAAARPAARDNEREIRERELLRLRLAYEWAVRHPATTDTGVETPGGPALDVLTTEESLGGDGTPAVAAFTPETFALKLGISPARRSPADRRRPRPTPPPPPALETRTPPAGAGLAGPPRRPTNPPLPLVGARWVDHRLAARTDASLGPIITDRLVALAIAKYDVEEQRSASRSAAAASDVQLTHPDPALYAGTSDLPPRRHPHPPGVPRPDLRPRPPAPRSTATPTPWGSARSKPSDSSPPSSPDKPPATSSPSSGQQPPRPPGRSGSTSWSTSTISTSTPRAERRSRPVRSRSSGRPPWPSCANGSATARSSSNPC